MRIVMTGGTSGIGLAAARVLLAKGADLLIGARNPSAAPAELRGRARFAPLDLADLASAQAFADQAAADGPFDAVLLNAAVQTVTGAKSAQGLELTFAANHLAHLLILRRLLGAAGQNARIILTSSGTHDPELKTGMPPPNHADARLLSYPERDPARDADPGQAGRRAYSTSKLCNAMTARELARRIAAARSDVMVAAFDPGFTPGTGLARDYPALVNFLFRRVLPIVMRGERISTPAASGAALAALASDPGYAGVRGRYLAMHAKALTDREPSRLARDPVACAKLWDDSEALLAELGFPA